MKNSTSFYIHNVILWILVIGYYFVITSFSATPAEQSTAESQAVVDIVEKVSEVVLHKDEGDAGLWASGWTLHNLVRKTAHTVNFFILAFLHSMQVFSYSRKNLHTVAMTLGMGFCGAVLDEITQLFFEGRSAQVSDVFVDFAGTISGCILFVVLCWIIKLKRG